MTGKIPAPKRRASKPGKAAKKFTGIRIDIETRASTDIKFGSYKYVEDPDFAVLVICYQPIYVFAGGATKLGSVRTMDLSSYDERAWFRRVIAEPRFQKHAYNANFERIGLSKWYGLPAGMFLDPINWHCTAVRANVGGVFGRLDEVAKELRSPFRKDAAGKRLINFFSRPIPARSKHSCGCVKFHEMEAHPTEAAAFEAYCADDVLTEAGVAALMGDVPEHVQAEYEFDQRINDRGVRHFATLSRRAMEQVEVEKDRLMGELALMTGLDNPNSGPQFNGWLREPEQDFAMVSLDKAHREEALADPTIPKHVAKALVLKGQASLSSVTKHKAALNSRCGDGRIRGMLGFYGAHTGREAGRVMQPQNLPTLEASKADRMRLLRGEAGPDAPRIAKGTVRATLVPAPGHVFVVADENAIEARVLAGLAGEKWAQAEFRGAGKIYEATAEQMGFMNKVDLLAGLKSCGKCGDKDNCVYCAIRGKSKVSNLAFGYGGGAAALVTMGAEKAGIDCGNYREMHAAWKAAGMPGKFWEWNRDDHDYPELLRLRDLYREASPATKRFWKLCEAVWDRAALQGQPIRFGDNDVLAMVRDGKHNRMVLPSERSIWYRHARSFRSHDNPDRVERRMFRGKGKGAGHVWTETHGGKLTENVTQAVARDVLFDVMRKIEDETAKGWPGRLVLHVHDEVVLEVPVKQAQQVLDDTLGIMAEPPEWGQFLVVKGEGKIMERYGK